jgi:Tol biopolymer transport system component
LDDQWVLEFARGLMSRLTFNAARETWPVWSPDGRQIVFAANPTGTYQLYRKAASGAGDEERLTMGLGKIPSDWSRDGRLVLYSEFGPNTDDDIWALPLDGDRTPRVVLQTPFDELDGQFSPDGKWIAYVSNESGRGEVYVQAFPPSGGKWQVSTTGGRAPRWRADGRELFYYKDDSASVMAADIRLSAGRVDVSRASQLFSLAMPGGVASPYDVTADGQRFLAQELVPQTARPPLTVVTNWQVALSR